MAPKNKEKEVDPGWEHGEMVAGDRHKVKCKWCHKILSGGIHRFKQHLAGIQGEAKACMDENSGSGGRSGPPPNRYEAGDT